ncbi:MAG: transposase, partial [Gammaproteobacteria bacterium]
DSDRYLLACMRYIELNPVRADMVKHPREYPWSSYAANAYGEENKLLTQHALYRQLDTHAAGVQSAYRQLFRAAIARADLDALREATNKGWVWGDDHFREKIARLSDRRATPKPKGRPKKVRVD